MNKPPEPIRLSIEAVAIMCRVQPIKAPDPNNKGKFISSFFEAGKRMMQNSRFLHKLKTYDRETIT